MTIEDIIRAIVREEVRAAFEEHRVLVLKTATDQHHPLPVWAKEFGCSSQYLGQLARAGRLKALRAGRRWLARREDVAAALTPPVPVRSEDEPDYEALARSMLARRAAKEAAKAAKKGGK